MIPAKYDKKVWRGSPDVITFRLNSQDTTTQVLSPLPVTGTDDIQVIINTPKGQITKKLSDGSMTLDNSGYIRAPLTPDDTNMIAVGSLSSYAVVVFSAASVTPGTYLVGKLEGVSNG